MTTLPRPRTSAPAPVAPAADRVDPADWMGLLDPTRSLADLTIPGTHNAGATRGGRWVACQHHPIADQLTMGVRFLDLRVRAHRGGLGIFHGPHHQRLDLGDVLETCAHFLRAHPTETVLACLNQEGDRLRSGELTALWNPYRTDFRDHLHEARKVPTLVQARGRIVLVSRHPAIAGIDHDGFSVQDEWHVPGPRTWARRKWPAIAEHLRSARASRGDGQMWSCFTSSTGWALPPAAAAALAHHHLRDHFAELDPSAGERNGVVLVDFAEQDLVRLLMERNHPARPRADMAADDGPGGTQLTPWDAKGVPDGWRGDEDGGLRRRRGDRTRSDLGQ